MALLFSLDLLEGFKSLLICLLSSLLFIYSAGGSNSLHGEEIKTVVLIIASDDMSVYSKLAKIWRSYMHSDPDHFECYFLRGNPNLSNPIEIIEDTIWCKTEENVMPGILNKTILSMEALLIKKIRFDYLLRTNLSSFYVFPRLLKCVSQLPRENCYAGCSIMKEYPFVTGCGFILSKDLVKTLVRHKDTLLGDFSDYDDVLLGKFLYFQKAHIVELPREEILTWNHWRYKQKNLNKNDKFHFRIKNDNPFLRDSTDPYIHTWLRNFFYPFEQTLSNMPLSDS